MTGIETGITELDKALLGLKGITTIQGEPGCNKSTIALQVANHHLKKTGPVIFFDRENGLNRLRMRYICQLLKKSEVDVLEMVSSNPDALSPTLEYVAKKPFYVFHEMNIEEIDAMIQYLVDKYGRHVLFIADSIQALPLMGEDKKTSVNKWLEFFDSMKLKYEKHLTILITSEKNRLTYGEASKAGGKESGSIEYKSEVVLDLRTSKDYDGIIMNIVKDRDGLSNYELIFRKVLADLNNPRSFCYLLEALKHEII